MIRRVLLVTSLLFIVTLLACNPASESGKTQTAPSQPTKVVVRILNLDAISAPTQPAPLPTQPPGPTIPLATTEATQLAPGPSSVRGSSPTITVPGCTNLAEFIGNLTIAENTALESNQGFAKLWRVKNVGTCAWTTDYALVFLSGDAMNGMQRIPLQQQVSPGEMLDLRVNLTTPVGPQNLVGKWMLQDANGANFGIGQGGSQPLVVAVVVRPPPKPTPG
jgi:hypothetical protein